MPILLDQLICFITEIQNFRIANQLPSQNDFSQNSYVKVFFFLGLKRLKKCTILLLNQYYQLPLFHLFSETLFFSTNREKSCINKLS